MRDLCRRKGLKIDRTEHVANSLGHLAAVVDRLNSLQHPLKVGVPHLHKHRNSTNAALVADSRLMLHK